MVAALKIFNSSILKNKLSIYSFTHYYELLNIAEDALSADQTFQQFRIYTWNIKCSKCNRIPEVCFPINARRNLL